MGTGYEGRLVSLKDNIAAFKEILAGDHDDLPEQAFYMIGDIQEVKDKARQMAGEEMTAEEKADGDHEADFGDEDVSVESFQHFTDTVYRLYDEQCAQELEDVKEFPDEVARLKSKHSKIRELMQ